MTGKAVTTSDVPICDAGSASHVEDSICAVDVHHIKNIPQHSIEQAMFPALFEPLDDDVQSSVIRPVGKSTRTQ